MCFSIWGSGDSSPEPCYGHMRAAPWHPVINSCVSTCVDALQSVCWVGGVPIFFACEMLIIINHIYVASISKVTVFSTCGLCYPGDQTVPKIIVSNWDLLGKSLTTDNICRLDILQNSSIGCSWIKSISVGVNSFARGLMGFLTSLDLFALVRITSPGSRLWGRGTVAMVTGLHLLDSPGILGAMMVSRGSCA